MHEEKAHTTQLPARNLTSLILWQGVYLETLFFPFIVRLLLCGNANSREQGLCTWRLPLLCSLINPYIVCKSLPPPIIIVVILLYNVHRKSFNRVNFAVSVSDRARFPDYFRLLHELHVRRCRRNESLRQSMMEFLCFAISLSEPKRALDICNKPNPRTRIVHNWVI